MALKDFYEILGIPKNASDDEIRKAYRQLALKYHPDRNPGDQAAETQFKEATEAFSTLSDSEKRSQYDTQKTFTDFGINFGVGANRVRYSWQSPNPRNPYIRNPFVDEIFGPPDDIPVQDPGEDITETINISLAESVQGCQKKIFVQSTKVRHPCENCSGTGAAPGSKRIPCMACASKGRIPDYRVEIGPRLKNCTACKGAGFKPLTKCSICKGTGKVLKHREVIVKVPAGINSGQRLRLAGCGGVGSPPGDLYVNVYVNLDDTFKRQGQDILTTAKISFSDAIQGCSIQVISLNGKEIHIDIPPGIQQGAIINIKGAGVSKNGDLLVQVHIEMPSKMTPRALELIKELAEEIKKSSH